MKSSHRRTARAQERSKWEAPPIEDLGPDFEDEIDLEHMYARDLFEHEQSQQREQQR